MDEVKSNTELTQTGRKNFKEVFQLMAVSMYIIDGNKTAAYRAYILGVNGKLPKGSEKSSASSFFAQPEIQDMVKVRKNRIKNVLLEEYLSEIGLSKSKIAQIKSSSKNEEVDSFEEVIAELKDISANSESDAARVSALKTRAEVEGLKKQASKNPFDNIIHCLPLPICDYCEHKGKLISTYQEEIDLRAEMEGKEVDKKTVEIYDKEIKTERAEYVPEVPEEI